MLMIRSSMLGWSDVGIHTPKSDIVFGSLLYISLYTG